MRTTDTIHTKNMMTGRGETIIQRNIERTDWGFHFFVDTELHAFKAAYQYRNSPHGTRVEFAKGADKWMVTVFNSVARDAKIDGAR